MTDDPNTRKELQQVEYVEAEPIEGSGSYKPEQPVAYVRTYQGGGCIPCCGPGGCIALLVILSYFFYEFEFVRAVAIGLIIFVVLSFLAGSVVRR